MCRRVCDPLPGLLALVVAVLVCLLCGPCAVAHGQQAGPQWGRHAVVEIDSHGGSGTVIYTAPGRTLILSAAHMFQGRDRARRIRLLAPAPLPGYPQRGGVRVLAVSPPDGRGDFRDGDLALLELAAGPLPYVAPIAAGPPHQGDRLLSVGYDDQPVKDGSWQPATMRWATYLGERGPVSMTREKPWHGRSGGALLDTEGRLVGVVSGYTGPHSRREVIPGCHGMYASHSAIVAFVQRVTAGQGRQAVPGVPQVPQPMPQDWPPGRLPPQLAPWQNPFPGPVGVPPGGN